MVSLLFPLALRQGTSWNCEPRCCILGHDGLTKGQFVMVNGDCVNIRSEETICESQPAASALVAYAGGLCPNPTESLA